MRLICSIPGLNDGQDFSTFLTNEGIENTCESIIKGPKGDPLCHIWVHNENDVTLGIEWYEAFLKSPDSPHFRGLQPTEKKAHPTETKQKTETSKEPFKSTLPPQKLRSLLSQASSLKITTLLLILCGLLFVWQEIDIKPLLGPTNPKEVTWYVGTVSSPIEKKLFFDYPETFRLTDQLVSLYSWAALENPAELPEEGHFLLQKTINTPYWEGFYTELQEHFTQPPTKEPSIKEASTSVSLIQKAPLFEKIREGQIWRLFTPCLLHGDLFHLFFNVVWLLILGSQIEQKIKFSRYLLLILVTGILTNTAQYLMSGFQFLGLSGIVCAMAAFIWTRQRIAAWEGYNLNKTTVSLIGFFILTMLIIQTASFFIEVYGNGSISPGIANTAHLSGIILGLILGRLPLFSWRPDLLKM